MTVYSSAAVLSGIKADLAKAAVVLCRSGEITTGDEFSIESMAIGDSIRMVPIPKGAMILDIQVAVDSAFTSPGATFTIGDRGAVARYHAGLFIPIATPRAYSNMIPFQRGRIYDSDSTIDLGPLSSNNDSGHTIRVHVFYKMTGTIVDETAFS